MNLYAEIITLRAIALKLSCLKSECPDIWRAEIITLRAIALKLYSWLFIRPFSPCRDHNATSYSTETKLRFKCAGFDERAEIITLRAIALKPSSPRPPVKCFTCRDHNATSYSTETQAKARSDAPLSAEIITLRAIALKPASSAQKRKGPRQRS